MFKNSQKKVLLALRQSQSLAKKNEIGLQEIDEINVSIEKLTLRLSILEIQGELLKQINQIILNHVTRKPDFDDLLKRAKTLFQRDISYYEENLVDKRQQTLASQEDIMEQGNLVSLTDEKRLMLLAQFKKLLQEIVQASVPIVFNDENEFKELMALVNHQQAECEQELKKTTEYLSQKNMAMEKIKRQLSDEQVIINQAISFANEFMSACASGNVSKVDQSINACNHDKQKLQVLMNAIDEDQNSALHIACKEGYFEIVFLLLNEGFMINQANKFGNFPMHYAAMYNNDNIIRALLKKGASVDAKGEYDRTPLHFAAMKGNYKTCLTLIKANANVNAKTDQTTFFRTPLLYAISYDHPNLVRLLLEKGARFFECNAEGQEPIVEAIISDQGSIVDELVSRYEKKFKKEGRPLDIYAKVQEWAQLTFIEKRDCARALEVLLKRHERLIAHQFQHGNQLIHMTVSAHAVNCVKTLITNHAPINALGAEGRSALHIAVFNGDLDLVKLLLDAGADVNKIAKDRADTTPLQSAIRTHNPDSNMIKLLLSKGADLETENPNKETIMEELIETLKYDVIEIIWNYVKTEIKNQDQIKYSDLESKYRALALDKNDIEILAIIFGLARRATLLGSN